MVHFMQNRPLSSPFEQEVILVQSPGMSQWLQIQLAESLGIATNIVIHYRYFYLGNVYSGIIRYT